MTMRPLGAEGVTTKASRGVTSCGPRPDTAQGILVSALPPRHAQMRMVQGGILLFAGGGEQAGRLARQDCTVFVFGPGFQGGTIGPFLVPPYKPNDQPMNTAHGDSAICGRR